jgi:hypothetical protein
MQVTANLHDGLKMLSSGRLERPKHVWIDALCIDQENIAERNEQVKNMSNIYKAAQGAIIWLGEEDEFCEDAFAVIESIAEIPEEVWKTVSYTGFYHPEDCYRKLGIKPLSFHNWLGFLGFISRSWFRRAWVVQELALARSATVVCGKRVVPWLKISKTLNFIKSTRWYHHLDTGKMRYIRELIRDPGRYKDFLQRKASFDLTPVYLDRTRKAMQGKGSSLSTKLRMLLETHRLSNATDPRDKIFAFLGVADKEQQPFTGAHNYITPDYGNTVQKVFSDTSRSILLSYSNLTLLSHVQDASSTKIPELPSWTPDYSVALWPYPLRFRGSHEWSAAGNLQWNPNIKLLEKGCLEAQGFLVDTVDAISLLPSDITREAGAYDKSRQRNPSSTSQSTAAWASVVSLAMSTSPRYTQTNKRGAPVTRFEALWRTLIANTYLHKRPAPSLVGQHFIDYILNLQIRQRLTPWPKHLDFQPHHDFTSEAVDPSWRSLFVNEPEDSKYGLQSYRQRFTEIMERLFEGTYSPMGLAPLQHEIEASSGNVRRLFKTSGQLMGIGPKSIQVGDEVWILAGANVPFILRGLDGGGKGHRLVGETYVHGIMHGDPTRHGKELTDTIIY